MGRKGLITVIESGKWKKKKMKDLGIKNTWVDKKTWKLIKKRKLGSVFGMLVSGVKTVASGFTRGLSWLLGLSDVQPVCSITQRGVDNASYGKQSTMTEDAILEQRQDLVAGLNTDSARLSTGTGKHQIIVFAVEAGIGFESSIKQVSARHLTSNDTFNCCVKEEFTDLENDSQNASRKTWAVKLYTALGNFKAWLEKYEEPILVSHKAREDWRLLVQSYQNEDIALPDIKGCVDSQELFRTVHPELKCYTLEALADKLLERKFTVKDPVSNVSTLAKLLKTIDHVQKSVADFCTENNSKYFGLGAL